MDFKEITKVPFELPDSVIDILEANSSIIYFKKNEDIVRKGEIADTLFFIREGLARLYMPASEENNREEIIAFGEAGDIATSVTSFTHGRPSIFSVSAVTKVSAYRVEAKVIKDLCEQSHVFCRWMMETALWQLSGLEVRYMFMALGDAYQRFLKFMRFKPAKLVRQIPLRYIASYLKVSPQTLSELRARYAKDCVMINYSPKTPYIDIAQPRGREEAGTENKKNE